MSDAPAFVPRLPGLEETLRGRSILVTGGSGFIGTNLISALSNVGARLTNVDIAPPRERALRQLWLRGNLLDPETMVKALAVSRAEFVVHLAARADLTRGLPIETFAVNTKGVQHVIDATNAARHVRRTIYASTRLVHDLGYKPSSTDDYSASTAYGKSKAIGERHVRSQSRQDRSDWVIVRPTGIWGPHGGVPYRTFFEAINSNRYLHPSGTNALKSYGFVGNTVFQLAGLLVAPEHTVREQTFYVADYEPVSVLQWATLIASIYGAKRVRSVPLAIARTAAILGDGLEMLGVRNPPLTSFRLRNLTSDMTYDMGPLMRIVGPLPYSVREGTEVTIRWLRAVREDRQSLLGVP